MMSMVYCRGCAKEIHESAVSCPHCGAAQNVKHVGLNLKTITPLAIACFFLGGIGLHRFMVGKIGTAILQFITCVMVVGFIWVLIDFIMIICGSFTDRDGKAITQW